MTFVSALQAGEPIVYIGLGLVILIALPLVVLLLRYWSTETYGRHDARNIERKAPQWRPDFLPVAPSLVVDHPIDEDWVGSRGRVFTDYLAETVVLPAVDPPQPPAACSEFPRQRDAGSRVTVRSGDGSPAPLERTVLQRTGSAA